QDGLYFLGMRLYECGRVVSAQWDISAVARPFLEQLAEQTGASAVVSYLGDGHILNLDQVAGRSGVQVLSEVGTQLPLHATAQGKLYLSSLSDADVCSILRARGMQMFTPHTLTAQEAVLEQLAQIRQNGCAIENGEYKIGLRAVCAPVFDRDGKLRYAVGVVGLFRYINSLEFDKAITATQACAQQISSALGCRSVTGSDVKVTKRTLSERKSV
ncbi:MAG: IclR family transcriptional regulator, partial [Oscillospiraceae bacterium]|nr:IclR family transcriptional regulator [Oscillospiraceae bacterium]